VRTKVWLVVIQLLGQMLILGVLTYAVIATAQTQSNAAQRMTDVAVLVAAIGSAVLLFWPVSFDSYVSQTISVDPTTGSTSHVGDSGVRTPCCSQT